MMRSKSFQILTVLLFLAGGLCAPAKDFPTIGKNPGITVGSLPDNVSYYLAENDITKGYANFILVQKSFSDVAHSRGLLLDLPHFKEMAPYEFLASKGVGYGQGGYVSYPDGNTVFTFEDVPTYDSAASDSTLLLIFDLVKAFDGEQAIIICGDITPKDMESRLHVFSLTVGPRTGRSKKAEYEWKPQDGPRFIHTENNTAHLAGISCTWSSPRTPEDRLDTPQPLVSYMFAGELEHIVRKRMSLRFMRENIPLAGFSALYSDSAASAGDEKYTYTVSISNTDMGRAMGIVAGIFADLDARGASLEEFNDAKMGMLSAVNKRLSYPVANAELAGQCVSSFLYGTNLVSPAAAREFFTDRKMDPEQELSLFNNFVSALLDSRRGLTIRCDTPLGAIDRQALLDTFASAWEAAGKKGSAGTAYRVNYGDTLSLLRPRGHRVKVKSTTTDPVSGGSIWSFSNGTRVVFKKTDQKGMLNYALLLKGGYSYVPGIGPGESAFVGDVLGLYRVGGMSPYDFHNMLDANGIEMRGESSLTDSRILGSVPSDKLELLLRVLLTYSRDRVPDQDAFKYYLACERLREERTRLSRDGIIAAIDSMMCPDYYYPSTKSVGKLRSDLPERVNEYLYNEFSKFNDGLLVLVGDADPAKLQKLLGKYLGQFRVSDEFSVRPKVDYDLRNTWSTYNVEASHSSVGSGEVCVNVGMATCKPFTIRSYSAFMIASSAMKRTITKALADVGMYADVVVDIQVFPAEKLTFYATCKSCDDEGLPAGIYPASALNVLSALRAGISQVSVGSISQADLKGLKKSLLNSLSGQMAQPDFLIGAILMRNSEGKDIVSNYADAVNAVTLEDVNSILHDLDFGSKIEYIIR